MIYALAPNGIYRSVQGEGALRGEPTVFVRLAGCSVGCLQCDTDYRVDRKADAAAIAAEARAIRGNASRVWITGGEPMDRDIAPLCKSLRAAGFYSIGLATSGSKPIPPYLVQWVSVSPHAPGRPAIWNAQEVKLVAGLNGLKLSECNPRDYEGFAHRFVAPCEGDEAAMVECLAWIEAHAGWWLGGQMHKVWQLP